MSDAEACGKGQEKPRREGREKKSIVAIHTVFHAVKDMLPESLAAGDDIRLCFHIEYFKEGICEIVDDVAGIVLFEVCKCFVSPRQIIDIGIVRPALPDAAALT